MDRVFACIEVERVSKVANDGLNDVFNRCDPLERTPFVGDRGHLLAILPELYQEIANSHRLRNDENLAGDVTDCLGILVVPLSRSEQVPDIDESDDLAVVDDERQLLALCLGLICASHFEISLVTLIQVDKRVFRAIEIHRE